MTGRGADEALEGPTILTLMALLTLLLTLPLTLLIILLLTLLDDDGELLGAGTELCGEVPGSRGEDADGADHQGACPSHFIRLLLFLDPKTRMCRDALLRSLYVTSTFVCAVQLYTPLTPLILSQFVNAFHGII
jgi:hypothetical protein